MNAGATTTGQGRAIQGNPAKFNAGRITTGPDKSAGKNIVTGASGVGKTYFVSTIQSDDGRPIFILPVEEGLKGASPLHLPAKFSDAHGNPILPTTFAELTRALDVFRDEVNFPRPPQNWIHAIGHPDGSPENDVLGALVEVLPYGLPISSIAQRVPVAASALPNVLDALAQAGRVRRHGQGTDVTFLARQDPSWRRLHLHFGVDSLSGIEMLVHQEITGRQSVQSMADKDYNVLFTQALPLWQQVRDAIDQIRRTGVHVWIIAHSTDAIEASENSGEIFHAQDLLFRGSGKVLIEIRQFWRQWADSIFYIQRDVTVAKGDKTRRTMAQFRGRKLVTTETAQCKAKSRLSLPPTLPATWDDLKRAMKTGAPAGPEKLRARVAAVIPRLLQEDQAAVAAELDAMGQNTPALGALLSRVEGMAICAEEARAEAAALAAAQGGTTETPAEDDEPEAGPGTARSAQGTAQAAAVVEEPPPVEGGL